MKEEPSAYNVIVSSSGDMPMNFVVTSNSDLVREYKDAVLGEKQFLIWENGCIEMKNMLGVFI